MRIHFFLRSLNDSTGGGSHYNSLAFIRALRAHGHTVVVHVFYDRGNAFPEDVQPIVHDGFGRGHLGERAYLAELLKESEPEADAYFLYAVEFAWGGGLYRRTGGKVPCVVYMDAYLSSMRRTHPRDLSMWWYQFKRLPWDKTIGLADANHIDQFLPVSGYIGDVYKEFGFPKDRFTILPSIVPPPPEAPLIVKDPSEVRVLYVGRLIYEKGLDLLIDALESLQQFPWKLVIVGDGPLRGEIEERVRTSGLPIDVKGWVTREEVWQAYHRADIFVHPARWSDPGPRSIVDALWCSLPVIVPDTGGSAWNAGDAGVVFKTGDLKSLTEALRTLLSDTDKRALLSKRAYTQAERFAESAIYPQLEGILLSAIQKAHV